MEHVPLTFCSSADAAQSRTNLVLLFLTFSRLLQLPITIDTAAVAVSPRSFSLPYFQGPPHRLPDHLIASPSNRRPHRARDRRRTSPGARFFTGNFLSGRTSSKLCKSESIEIDECMFYLFSSAALLCFTHSTTRCISPTIDHR